MVSRESEYASPGCGSVPLFHVAPLPPSLPGESGIGRGLGMGGTPGFTQPVMKKHTPVSPKRTRPKVVRSYGSCACSGDMACARACRAPDGQRHHHCFLQEVRLVGGTHTSVKKRVGNSRKTIHALTQMMRIEPNDHDQLSDHSTPGNAPIPNLSSLVLGVTSSGRMSLLSA